MGPGAYDVARGTRAVLPASPQPVMGARLKSDEERFRALGGLPTPGPSAEASFARECIASGR